MRLDRPKAEKNGRVSVLFGGPDGNDGAWTRRDHRDRHGLSLLVENLSHANLLPQYPYTHRYIFSFQFQRFLPQTEILEKSGPQIFKDRNPIDQSLIWISTPEERLSCINASMVFCVGSTISIRRLCVLISNCSRASLSL